MPTYEYRCPEGHDFEQFVLNMSKAAAELPCPVCGKLAVRRISAGAGLVFKGSGFYITDYGKDGKKDQRSGGEAKGDTGSGEAKGGGAAEKSGGEAGKGGGEAKGDTRSGEAKGGGAAEKSSGQTGPSSGDSKGGGAAEKGSAKREPSAKPAPTAPPKKPGGAE